MSTVIPEKKIFTLSTDDVIKLTRACVICLVYFEEISLSMIFKQTYFTYFFMCYLHHLFAVTYPFKYHFLIASR